MTGEVRTFELRAAPEDAGTRADTFLSRAVPGYSRSALKKLMDAGAARIGGVAVKPSQPVRSGDLITLECPVGMSCGIIPQDIPVEVVYEDGALLVVDKPRGLCVHPSPGHESGTLVNGLLAREGSLSSINGIIRPGIVHRIDKDTSGLLVVAKTNQAHEHLALQFARHTILREYRAVATGVFREQSGEIDAPIARDPHNRLRMSVQPQGRSALTRYQVIRQYPSHAYIACRLATGRTHQIRVHMRHLNHPIAGDPLYGSGSDSDGLGGQLLHAGLLGFTHPLTGEKLAFTSPVPEIFRRFCGPEPDFTWREG